MYSKESPVPSLCVWLQNGHLFANSRVTGDEILVTAIHQLQIKTTGNTDSSILQNPGAFTTSFMTALLQVLGSLPKIEA